jgi:hypothetical protein
VGLMICCVVISDVSVHVLIPQRWLGVPAVNRDFELALYLAGSTIASLVRNPDIEPSRWNDHQRTLAVELADWLDQYSCRGLNRLPRLATMLANYFKSALIDLYRGANTVKLGPAGSILTFTNKELAAFRHRFRRSPMTDEHYLDFINKHFAAPLQTLRRKQHSPKASFSRLRRLHPRRDTGDFLFPWPQPPGSRLKPSKVP